MQMYYEMVMFSTQTNNKSVDPYLLPYNSFEVPHFGLRFRILFPFFLTEYSHSMPATALIFLFHKIHAYLKGKIN